MRKDKIRNIIKILRLLESRPDGVWLREIARTFQISPETVRRSLQEISEYIHYQDMNTAELSLPNMPVLIKIKRGYTFDGIVKMLSMKEKLSSIRQK